MTLNGEDQDAFIADANLERRDLTKGQKAMLIAVRVPKQQGKKATSLVSKDVHYTRVSQARTVIEHASELVDLVIDGSMGLDAALAEATRRRLSRQRGKPGSIYGAMLTTVDAELVS
ncbi:hypothetical protein PQR34_44025 [Paraburkholderia sediminicola]|uniref:hypothetical protein n=1 Tax=Paraburkholderia sediminicola TaxID=458836 RepID=UPI0038BAD95C